MSHRPFLAALTVLIIAATSTVTAAPAHAATAPTWADVLDARGNEAAAEAKAAELTALVQQLEDATAAANDTATARGQELQTAQDAADAAAGRSDTLTAQATTAREEADGAEKQIAAWSGYLSRSAGRDLTASITSDGDNLLERLGTASKVTDTMNAALEDAATRAGTATALSKQAAAARRERDRLQDAAASSFAVAAAAAEAAATAEADQRTKKREITDQLAVLRNRTLSTEAAYAEAERRRVAAARAEAARVAAEAAARAAQAPAVGGSTGGTGARPSPSGAVSASGWTNPITSYSSYQAYGNRLHPILGYYRLHAGDDFGAACGTSLYATAAGTVTYAGPYGDYGNLITIDQGNGVTSNYAHMFSSGVLVRPGQKVTAGQVVGAVGNAGLSTGCHLHFEIRQNGAAVPPTPFLNARGA
ncbi:M23 family metallopeptidase [Curtobacterium flaccumfaciens]|uniref:M23 family metallopeptidase n=1 Tax=Curtobacterium flaccumfaciens TaxID=2035 RepID=UPI00188D4CE4|nr:M23 family metallopeptidase [Curtobacterium flaccumfaciens]MBF4629283.1 M23 family metallopeptidase [Curtobacterium flaccumfaciens]